MSLATVLQGRQTLQSRQHLFTQQRCQVIVQGQDVDPIQWTRPDLSR